MRTQESFNTNHKKAQPQMNEIALQCCGVGGTAFAIIANLGLQDYVSTIILAALGAVVSFVVTKFLKVAWDWIKGK